MTRTDDPVVAGAVVGATGRAERVLRLLVPAIWYVGILTLSALPASVYEPVPAVPGLSYLAHAVLYGVLGSALWWALGDRRRPVLIVALLGMVCGVGDELLQSTVPGRDPSWLDLGVDVAAASVTALVAERRSRA